MIFWKKTKTEKAHPALKQWKITRRCLRLILESAKASYPREFGGFLRVDREEKDTITEIVLLPGTVSGDAHAIFQLHMLPIDFTIIGTAHSHPSGNPHPSEADLHLFEKYGRIHIIAATPYTETSWKAYTYDGEEIPLRII
ncbi:MAG: Mov34/MPN/PAD-1 family protein [Methanobacteriota archaeon]